MFDYSFVYGITDNSIAPPHDCQTFAENRRSAPAGCATPAGVKLLVGRSAFDVLGILKYSSTQPRGSDVQKSWSDLGNPGIDLFSI